MVPSMWKNKFFAQLKKDYENCYAEWVTDINSQLIKSVFLVQT